MNVYLDIETAPSTQAPDWTKVKPPRGYKDPEKIKQYQLERAAETWRGEALSIPAARVVMVGACVDDGPIEQAMNWSEQAVMESFTRWLMLNAPLAKHPNEPGPVWVGYNAVGFDFPILSTRLLRASRVTAETQPDLSASMLLYSRALRPPNSRYGGPSHRDPFVALGHNGKLHEWSEMFGLGHTDVDGSQVFDLMSRVPKEALAKNASDIETLRKLTKILSSAGWL